LFAAFFRSVQTSLHGAKGGKHLHLQTRNARLLNIAMVLRLKMLLLLKVVLAVSMLWPVVNPHEAAAAAAAAASICKVHYTATAQQNLLLGGVHSSCIKGCQPRSDRW
jgi:hypothetical protein